MAWAFTLYSLPPFLAAAIAVPVAVETWRHREEPSARALLALIVALFVWSLTYGIQLGVTGVEAKMDWQRVSLVIGSWVAALWLVFALQYAGLWDRIGRRRALVLVVDPVVYAALVFTNSAHELVWTGVSSGAGPGLHLVFGPAYWVHIAWAYGIVTLGIGVLAWVAADATTIHRRQALVLLAAALVPFAANIAFTFGASPVSGLDLTTFTFALSVSLIVVAMFRLDLLDITPVARRHWIAQLGDGVVVLAADGRVVDLNDVAAAALDPAPAVGDPVLPSLPTDDLTAIDGLVLEATIDGEPRFFDLRYTSLTDHHGRPAGSLVGLRDVTERTHYERRLEVANRVLRHNFRNAMNVVQGHATTLAAELEGEQAERARAIERRATEVIDLNEGIQQIATTLDHETATVSVSLTGAVIAAAERVRFDYPDVRVSVDAPREVTVSATDGNLVHTAIDHVVENAAEHNDTDDPAVRIEVVVTDGRAAVRVADNGPGIPREERVVLEGGEETPLSHGSGIGLWLVSWVLSASGGALRFEENQPRGTVVTLEFPLAARPTTAAD